MASPSEYLRSMFPEIVLKLALALIILLVGFIVARVLGKIIQKILSGVELNNILKRSLGIKVSVEEMIGSFITYFIYLVAVIFALDQIGLAPIVLNILFGGIIVIIIIAIFLSVKDFIPNMFAGIYIHQKRNFQVGNKIQVKGIEGTVTDISLIETQIKTKSGDTIHIPNSIMTREELVIKKR